MTVQANEGELVVADDLVVSLLYTLLLEDGEAIEHTDEHEPLEFIQGHGQIIPGLEDALYGMKVGEKKAVIVDEEAGYGAYDDENVEVMPRNAFPADVELAVGMGLRLRDQDTDDVHNAFISELNDKDVLLDFNHPLAGETLHFQVQVVGLRPATAEELAHNHVHDAEDAHS
jgi:FKBP-type peptidyl-prolyl cis-trans isomerase SlyD